MGRQRARGGDWKRMNRHLPIGSKQVQYSSLTLHLHSVTIVSCVCCCPSVHSGPSAGFEAFFTGIDILVVAIVTKKNYITVKIPDCNLSTGWVSVRARACVCVCACVWTVHVYLNCPVHMCVQSVETMAPMSALFLLTQHTHTRTHTHARAHTHTHTHTRVHSTT